MPARRCSEPDQEVRQELEEDDAAEVEEVVTNMDAARLANHTVQNSIVLV